MIISNTLQGIATLLLDHPTESREHLLFQEIDTATIYTSNCWDIINEERPLYFYDYEAGDFLNTPEQLAWKILYDRFISDYGILLTE